MSIAPHLNEKELIERITMGDRRAFTMLFDAYYRSLGQYVYKMTESLEATEEIVQDVFIKVWLKKDNLSSINNFSNYLFILSRNHTLNYLRKQATYKVHFQTWDGVQESNVGQPEVSDNYEDFRLLVEKAIEMLPAQQKKIYELCKVEKLKYEDVAAQLNLSLETVRKHMYLASKAIKMYIKQHIDEAVVLVLLSPLVFF